MSIAHVFNVPSINSYSSTPFGPSIGKSVKSSQHLSLVSPLYRSIGCIEPVRDHIERCQENVDLAGRDLGTLQSCRHEV
jgi:hypothetical protein